MSVTLPLIEVVTSAKVFPVSLTWMDADLVIIEMPAEEVPGEKITAVDAAEETAGTEEIAGEEPDFDSVKPGIAQQNAAKNDNYFLLGLIKEEKCDTIMQIKN